MKYIPIVALSLVFCSFTFLKWIDVQDYDGRFQITVPSELTEKVDTIETVIGKVPHHTFFIQPEDKKADNLFYSIVYYDFPVNDINSDSSELVQEFFENTTQSSAESVGGKLIYSSPDSLIGFPGYFWRVDYLNGKAVIKTKAWLVDYRYYELKTISLKEKSVNSDSERFFNSFKLMIGR